LKSAIDKYGGEEESWGRKKFVNAKKPDTVPLLESPALNTNTVSPDSAQENVKKPKQFLDRNNMFSLLPKN
jgi:hypothetical protein